MRPPGAAPRMVLTPSSGKELQELCTVAADELWMSTCYGRDSLAIHFTWMRP